VTAAPILALIPIISNRVQSPSQIPTAASLVIEGVLYLGLFFWTGFLCGFLCEALFLSDACLLSGFLSDACFLD